MITVQTTNPVEAASFIKRGGIVAFPTETVYGLAASVFDEAAIGKIFIAKARPQDNPLIAHVASIDQLSDLVKTITPSAEALIAEFFPGPLTVILPKADAVPLLATAGLNTIGVRMPRSPLAQDFVRACGVPVVAPSANFSGRPSPTTYQAVLEDLDGRIDAVLISDQTELGLESTVVDCTGRDPVLLRAGAVTLEELREVAPTTLLAEPKRNEPTRSPGLSHRHYSPRARVVLVRSVEDAPDERDAGFIGFAAGGSMERSGLEYLCDSLDDYAHELFLFFRMCDAANVRTIYCQTIPEDGIGRAIMDRLRRAAEGYVPSDVRGYQI